MYVCTYVYIYKLCFLKSHFGNIPLASILTVISSYFSEDEICKAKLILHELCVKYLGEDNVPRLIIRKGENKRKTDSEDVGHFFKLLDEHKIELPLFVALNARRIPHIDPANVDLCFLLESVEELRRSVSSLMDVKKVIDGLQTTVTALSRSSVSSNAIPPQGSSQRSAVNNQQVGSAEFRRPSTTNSAKPSSHAESLRVNIPPLSNSRQQLTTESRRVKPIVGTKQVESSCQCKLKASSEPRGFHIYIGNLDLSAQSSDVEDYLKDANIKVLSCELLRSSRISDDYVPRAASAHVVIDVTDKALNSATGQAGIVVRPWRFPCKDRFNGRNQDSW